MPHTPITGGDWPQCGEGVIIAFPNSNSDPLRSYVIEHIAQPRPHLLLAAPLIDGEATVAAKGEAILVQWQSKKVMRSLGGTVDGFVDTGIAAWRVSVGEVGGAKAVDRVHAVSEVASVEAINRRRHVRVPIRRRVEVITAGRKISVETIDISESGVRCRWRGDSLWVPSTGSSVTVSLEIGPGRPITLNGSVVRLRPASGGAELSVAFAHLNESSQTVQLLRRYIVALERRQLLRDQDRS
jgi:hypothetical protein